LLLLAFQLPFNCLSGVFAFGISVLPVTGICGIHKGNIPTCGNRIQRYEKEMIFANFSAQKYQQD
jgi:hypothetical protein